MRHASLNAPLRIGIMNILAEHRNTWLKSREVAIKAGMNTPEGINNVSSVLYRLRHVKHIERRHDSTVSEYKYHEERKTEIKRHPANVLPISKPQSVKKAGGKKGNPIKFVVGIEPREGYCEYCECSKPISYKAECENTVLFLCDKCGKAADKEVCGYGGCFQ